MHVRLMDRDAEAIRVVMPLATDCGIGIWERWTAFINVGRHGDSLIICDLVEDGYLDADLHVIPEQPSGIPHRATAWCGGDRIALAARRPTTMMTSVRPRARRSRGRCRPFRDVGPCR